MLSCSKLTSKWTWGEDARTKKNFSHALGIEMLGLDNAIMITVVPFSACRSKREHELDTAFRCQADEKETSIDLESVPARPPPAHTFNL